MTINNVSNVPLSAMVTGPKILISFTEMNEFVTLLKDEVATLEEYNSKVANLDAKTFGNVKGKHYTDMNENLEKIGYDLNKTHDDYLTLLNKLIEKMEQYISEFETLNQPK